VEESLYLVNEASVSLMRRHHFHSLPPPPKLIILGIAGILSHLIYLRRQLHHEYLKSAAKLLCNSSHKVCLVYHVECSGSIPIYISRAQKSLFQFKKQSITRSCSDDEAAFKGFSLGSSGHGNFILLNVKLGEG
jgi:hypothetical protein